MVFTKCPFGVRWAGKWSTTTTLLKTEDTHCGIKNHCYIIIPNTKGVITCVNYVREANSRSYFIEINEGTPTAKYPGLFFDTGRCNHICFSSFTGWRLNPPPPLQHLPQSASKDFPDSSVVESVGQARHKFCSSPGTVFLLPVEQFVQVPPESYIPGIHTEI